MNIVSEIQNYKQAKDTMEAALLKVSIRIEKSTKVVKSIAQKSGLCYEELDDIPSLAWAHITSDAFNKILVSDEGIITLFTPKRKRYEVPSAFINGSDWDIAKATRDAITVHRMKDEQFNCAEHKRLKLQRDTSVRTMERLQRVLESYEQLAQEDVNRRAKHKGLNVSREIKREEDRKKRAQKKQAKKILAVQEGKRQ